MGDLPGHEFHGNQWTTAKSGGGSHGTVSKGDWNVRDELQPYSAELQRASDRAFERRKDEYERVKAFHKALDVKDKPVGNAGNVFWSYMDTSKGPVGLTFGNTTGDGASVEIHWLHAQKRGSGRVAMERIVQLADEHKVTLKLHALPLAGQDENKGFTPSNAQLERFYRGFGFEVKSRESGGWHGKTVRSAFMVRRPK